MAKKLDELAGLFAAAWKRMAGEGEAALSEAFKELFDKHPKLKAVRWKQYTPYFNDGEPCEFSVHDPYILFEGCPEDGGDYEDGYMCCSYYKDEKNPEGFGAAAEAVKAIFRAAPEELLEATFDDHVQVTATRDKTFEVEEYRHD
jgi:hypothetical protein